MSETLAKPIFSPSPSEAANELLRRLRAKSSLAAYIDYIDLPGIVPAAHHRLLIDALEAVDRGECKRLMICMPPGSAKSTYTSAIFPAWYLGRHPMDSVIAASHTLELAERFGRRVRNLFSSAEHHNVFKIGVKNDSHAASRWDTTVGGEYYAAGVSVGIAGLRARLGIIDDPVRSREDADSDRTRQKTWDWYVNDFVPRLLPDAAQIIIMTRWHEDDLGGRILEREAGKWNLIELAMEALPNDPLGRKVGERLWPEWFTEEMVADAKLDTRVWNALYQQQPASEMGDYFKADWFTEYDTRPDGLKIYAASDCAVTEDGGDFTEHGIFGVDPWDNMYILDWWRGQTTSDVWIDAMSDMILRYKPECWFGESGPIRRAVQPYMTKRLTERQAYCRIEWMASIADKEARCRSFQALASMGKVWVPKNARWKADVMGELLRFPAGRYDDAVDVCSLIGRGLDMIRKPKIPVANVGGMARVGGGTGWMAS